MNDVWASCRAEILKVVTTKAWWVLTLSMVSLTAALSLMVPISLEGASNAKDVAGATFAVGATFGYAFPLALGALIVTAEYGHGTLVWTFLGNPCRIQFTMTKTLTAATLGLIVGLIGASSSIAFGVVSFHFAGMNVEMDTGSMFRIAAASTLLLGLWCIIGAGLGAACANQTTAVVAIVIFTQVIEPALRLSLSSWHGGEVVTKFLPGAASEALVGSSFYSSAGLVKLLAPQQGGLVLFVYAVIAALVGAAKTWRVEVSA